MKFDEVYDQISNIKGWMGLEDCGVLFKYAYDVSGTIVEVGSYHGRSTKLLALSSPTSKVYAIDPKQFEEFKSHTRGLNVELINSKSEDVVWDKPIDLLHVDGDHKYQAVKKDIVNFVPHLRPGSFALFHDYVTLGRPGDDVEEKMDTLNNKEYGVVRAIHELKDKYFDQVKLESGFAVCRRKS